MLTSSDIARDEAVVQAAAPLPWESNGCFVRQPGCTPLGEWVDESDAKFSAAARNRWPLYIEAAKEANRLRERVAELENLCLLTANFLTEFDFIPDELFRRMAAAGDAAKGGG